MPMPAISAVCQNAEFGEFGHKQQGQCQRDANHQPRVPLADMLKLVKMDTFVATVAGISGGF